MKLRKKVIINSLPDHVWPHVSDPVMQADWNPKIISIDRDKSGPVRAGEHFAMIYRMSGNDRVSQVSVSLCVPPEYVEFQHRYMWKNKERMAEEIYQLTPTVKGVRVDQIIDLAQTGIPWPFRFLMWIISKIGTSTGQPYLERLKEIVEDN